MAVTATAWGDSTSSKRVLLIHGITQCSQFWYRLAEDFVSQGYFVTAPDLLGHGCARRSSVYTIPAMVEELRPVFRDGVPPYDIVIGYSLGGVVTAALMPLLKSTRPVRVVLIDPPLEVGKESLAWHRNLFSEMVGHPRTPEALLQENPLWTKEDAIIAHMGMQLCGVDVVQAILDQNVPWSFSHYLSTVPDNLQVTALAADPSKWCCMKEEDVKAYPYIKTKTIWGASHLLPLEDSKVVFEAALEGKDEANDLGA